LEQISAVLQQDDRMKDVFGELDGFILIVSVLSTLRDDDSSIEQWDSTMCAAFKAMIVALTSHPRNHSLFEVASSRAKS
jgi:hypothetical protein